MSSRTRAIVLAITAPVVALRHRRRRARHRHGAGRHLSAPQDLRRRGEPDFEQLRRAGQHRQGDARRHERPRRLARPGQRAICRADEVKQAEIGAALPAGDLGIELTRQYYLRVLAARDNSPAAKAGLRTGDYVRAINDVPDARHERVAGHARAARRRRIEGHAHDLPRQRRRSARRRR